MNNEFGGATPTLTLDPFEGQVVDMPGQAPQMVAPVEEKPEILDDRMLSEEEKQQVAAFANQIDITNSGVVLQYGAGTQKKMADYSETALNNVKSKDLGEIGGLLSGVVTELKGFGEEEQKGFLGIFKKPANQIQAMKAKYAKAETNINTIIKALESHQVQLLKDTAMLDKMYDMNLAYFKELTMYILAGKKRLQDIRATELQEKIAIAKQSGLPEDAQAARDLEAMCDRFEKKVHDLELTRTIAMQTAPQIRLVQSSNTMMVEKIQSTMVNTIPLWKSQMVIALGVQHAQQAANAQREVTNMTNELLKKNADALKTATIDTARESERGIVDIETLKHTNESLISTLDEVMKIQEEGRIKRREAEVEMMRLETDLKQKLLQING